MELEKRHEPLALEMELAMLCWHETRLVSRGNSSSLSFLESNNFGMELPNL